MTTKERDKQEAIKELRAILKKGDTLHTILRHVSRSGMTRHISVIFTKNNQIISLDHLVSKALDRRRVPFNKGEGVIVSGCGMDMGFEVVYALSSAVFGYKNRGGYALKQHWM